MHALRLSEVPLAVAAVRAAPWADPARMVLAGTSEGAPAVARYRGAEFAGRIIFSVELRRQLFRAHPRHRDPGGSAGAQRHQPERSVLLADPTAGCGNPAARGHCGVALKDHKQASVVLIPGAPHTLINLPAARQPVEGFLRAVLKP